MTIYLTEVHDPGVILADCPYHNLGCSVMGVTTFHRHRRRRRSSLWPFYSYYEPRGSGSHPSDRSAQRFHWHQLSTAAEGNRSRVRTFL